MSFPWANRPICLPPPRGGQTEPTREGIEKRMCSPPAHRARQPPVISPAHNRKVSGKGRHGGSRWGKVTRRALWALGVRSKTLGRRVLWWLSISL
eukprot:scaffold129651_cov33-Tisochrysis_lutea.AAC.3